MNYKKIFLKGAKPTTIGGQAIMEGVMMRGHDRNAIAMRIPDGRIFLETEKQKPMGKWHNIPLVRGVVSFFYSLIIGVKTLMRSASILEQFLPEEELEKPSKFENWIEKKFGSGALWNFLLVLSVIFSLAVSVGIFVIFPTVAVNWLSKWVTNPVVLNLIEGLFRIVLFILYVLLIRLMEDIKKMFRYHGAEHKTIHCFENGMELTPENAKAFYCLHPRCGTSFIMFVFIISLLVFSLVGWPNAWLRVLSRILLLPVIAGISYELLKWAGKSDNIIVKILSWPGLMTQRLTTMEPTEDQLEIAIVALKAVLVDADYPEVEGFADVNANIVEAKSLNDLMDERDSYMPKHKETTMSPAPEGATNAEGDFDIDDLSSIMGATEAPAALEEVKPPRRPEGDTIIPWPELEGKRYSNDPDSVENTLKRGKQVLEGIENGANEAVDLFCYLTGMTKSQILTRQKEMLTKAQVDEYASKIGERLAGKPMQYITKVQEFMDLPFKVNESVLIPRLDTEVLAEQVIGVIKGKNWQNAHVLDLCCGSGILGITLAHEFPELRVTLSDVSDKAVEVAKQNAEINRVADRCEFRVGNMLEPFGKTGDFDLIACNPPYIPTKVIDTLAKEVRDYEPRLALDGGEDGMDAYRKLAMDAARYIKSGGILALEIGHDQAKDVSFIFEITTHYCKPVVIKDLNDMDRVLLVERR